MIKFTATKEDIAPVYAEESLAKYHKWFKSLPKGTEVIFIAKRKPVQKGGYTEEFEDFWSNRYKGRWNTEKGIRVKVGKAEAFKVWKRMSDEDKCLAYAKAPKLTGTKITKDCCRWLEKRMFED